LWSDLNFPFHLVKYGVIRNKICWAEKFVG